MNETRAFRRGDVVLVAYPFATDLNTQKIRPAVIVQNDIGNQFSANVILLGISSQLPQRSYPTDVILRRESLENQGTGLDRDSVIQASNLLTVAKRIIVQRLGRLSDETMRRVDECLRVSLGLTR